MTDAPTHTLRFSQSTIPLPRQARQPLAMERGFEQRYEAARSGAWECPTYQVPLTPHHPLRAALLCLVCMVLGVAAGHVVRESSAHASPSRGSSSAARTAVTASATSLSTTRRKEDETMVSARIAGRAAAGATVSTRRASSRRLATRTASAAAAPAGPSPPDPLFIDFEPTFRTAP